MSVASNVLAKIPGELLAPTRNGLPQAQPDSPDSQSVIIRLPDGTRVEVHGCDLFRFRDGKIALKNSYRKNRPPLPRPNA